MNPNIDPSQLLQAIADQLYQSQGYQNMPQSPAGQMGLNQLIEIANSIMHQPPSQAAGMGGIGAAASQIPQSVGSMMLHSLPVMNLFQNMMPFNYPTQGNIQG